MILKLISDEHRGAVHAFNTPFNIDDKNLYDLGDNDDLKNCKRSEIVNMIIDMGDLSEAMKGRRVSGNHDWLPTYLDLDYHVEFQVIEHPDGDILLFHGYQVKWTLDHILKARQKDAGQSKWQRRRLYVSKYFSEQLVHQYKIEQEIKTKLSNKVVNKCTVLMDEHDCKYCIFGHTHTRHLIVHRTAQNKVIINIPRGITTLSINKNKVALMARQVGQTRTIFNNWDSQLF